MAKSRAISVPRSGRLLGCNEISLEVHQSSRELLDEMALFVSLRLAVDGPFAKRGQMGGSVR